MYNNYGNIESIEPENKIIDDRNSHKYVKEDAKESANETTGLIKNDTTYSTLNHSKSIYDPFRENVSERNRENNEERKDALT